MYAVIVSNIGTVYEGEEAVARQCFSFYKEQSQTGVGRAGDEDVTLLFNDEIIEEYFSPISNHKENL